MTALKLCRQFSASNCLQRAQSTVIRPDSVYHTAQVDDLASGSSITDVYDDQRLMETMIRGAS